jgi:hypothetical protein
VFVTGEESFIDSDGNGFYTEGERWTNLPEAFTDHNEDGVYTPVQRANCDDPATADDICLAGFEETYQDLNNNGEFDLNDSPESPSGSSLPDGLYNGVLCREQDEAMGICSRELLHTFASEVIVLAPFVDEYYALIVDDRGREETNPSGGNYLLFVSDLFNNPPPAGTEISVAGTGGCSVVEGDVTIPAPSRNTPGAYTFPFTVAEDPAPVEEGAEPDTITVQVTMPDGNYTKRTYACGVERVNCDEPQFSPGPYCPET